ncbi:MAG: hypothetical protein JOY80_10135 [Candidatus Dormibacteraeota bacterium]|nr:hypothetical protein [Candidatus Dormibacteraeota bacterium]
MGRRLMAVLAVVSALMLAAAAVPVLGTPDFGSVVSFLSGEVSGVRDGQAVVVVIAWLVVAGSGSIIVIGTLRGSPVAELTRSRLRRAALLFVAGTLLLSLALIHHGSAASDSVCCGGNAASLQEAVNLAR